ncbi:GNAT family N-acetyltransferase [Candidatus Gottesmanbacteria bacterium]|nr:GNAT family N-acetyltransferase [Candidatus Gottesmanbacteria bacterium]
MNKIIFKNALELTDKEIKEINDACVREFHDSMGQLISVEPVKFKDETFSILGIGGIVSNIKGKGYGKKIMTAIKQYLIKNCKTGIGFCGLFNRPFYEKCGFFVNQNSLQRFVYYEKSKKIVNVEDEAVLYFDSDDHFMEKALAYPTEEVLLPRPPNW